MSRSHGEVTIEERAFDEVVSVRGRRIAPKGVPVANPAFDATPPELVTAVVTDLGVIERPLVANIAKVMR
jgi:methylthioribose-1-phosphate isomerase